MPKSSQKNRVYGPEEKQIALTFLKACGGDFKRAAKLAAVEERMLRFWAGGGDETEAPDLSVPAFAVDRRPIPPTALLDEENPVTMFAPALDLMDWMRATFIDEGGAVFNEDHWHLRNATIGVLWTNLSNRRGSGPYRGIVVGTAEMGDGGKGNLWQKARAAMQLRGWFGEVPNFLITLDAPHAAGLDDASFCAVCEHEMYHCLIAFDEFDLPRQNDDGEFTYRLRPHDVEDFTGIWRRYGPGCGAGASKEMAAYANRRPEIAAAQIGAACGTCKRDL